MCRREARSWPNAMLMTKVEIGMVVVKRVAFDYRCIGQAFNKEQLINDHAE